MENNQSNGDWWTVTFGEDQPGTNDRKGSVAELFAQIRRLVASGGIAADQADFMQP
jgi:hypothetical protein